MRVKIPEMIPVIPETKPGKVPTTQVVRIPEEMIPVAMIQAAVTPVVIPAAIQQQATPAGVMLRLVAIPALQKRVLEH